MIRTPSRRPAQARIPVGVSPSVARMSESTPEAYEKRGTAEPYATS
jgi:hypothetical protein